MTKILTEANIEAKMMLENTGFIKKLPQPTDYIAGTGASIIYNEILPSGDWISYYPTDEWQHGFYFDTKACVSFSANNCVETQVNMMIRTGLIPEWIINKLKKWGYIDKNGNFNLSDRYLAKMSGTTKKGNYMQKVAHTLKHFYGVPETMWDYPRLQRTPVFDWDDYYKNVSEKIIQFAKDTLGSIFEIEYEWVYNSPKHIRKQIKQAPLQIASPICAGWSTKNPVPACDKIKPSHATMLGRYYNEINKTSNIFDHYKPINKNLALNYPIPYFMKIVIKLKKGLKNTNMITYKLKNKSTVYAAVGATLIPFSTIWKDYAVDFEDAALIELTPQEFKKFKIAKGVKITKK